MSKSEKILLTSIVTHKNEFSTSFNMSGEPQARALVDAVIDQYHKITKRIFVTQEMLEDMSKMRIKATVLRIGENMMGTQMIVATQGTLFNNGDAIGMLPKGARKNGFRINKDRFLDIENGYTGIKTLEECVSKVRNTFPVLKPLTQERLEQLPDRGNRCTLAVFGTTRIADETIPGCIWLVHSYIKDGDILEGVLIVPDSRLFSEHGSIFGKTLMTMGGEITTSIDITLKEALELTEKPYEDTLKLVTQQKEVISDVQDC